MVIEKAVHEMLLLAKEWEVSSCESEQETQIFFVIKETPALWERERCPKDGGEVFCYDHVEPMRWKHLNIFNQRGELIGA